MVRYVRTQWLAMKVRKFMKHGDGYFLIPLYSAKGCDEVVSGGLYFINRNPIVVMKWNEKFNF